MSVLTADKNIDTILSDLYPFNTKQNGHSAAKLKTLFVKLHNEGTIKILTENLLDEKTWDATIRIDIKNLSAHDLVSYIIAPLQIYARFDEVRMLSNNIIEFWWD